MAAAYVLMLDASATQSERYFVRLGLGIFWECDTNIARARKFRTRAQAAKVLIANGKNHDGWRVVRAN